MVGDSVTDGRRIAELLASELTGLERGPLAAVEVVDADCDADPTPEGTRAYAIAHDGARVGVVHVHPECARVDLSVSLPGEDPGPSLSVERDESGATLTIASGAAVKRAVDLLVAAL